MDWGEYLIHSQEKLDVLTQNFHTLLDYILCKKSLDGLVLIPVPTFKNAYHSAADPPKHTISPIPYFCDCHLSNFMSLKRPPKKYLIHNDIFRFLSVFINALNHETARVTKFNFQSKGLCMGLYHSLFTSFASDRDLLSRANSFRWFYLQLNRFFAHFQSCSQNSKIEEVEVTFKCVRNGGRKHWGFHVECMTEFLKSIQKYNSNDFYFDVFFLEQWLT
jgi:hypothetical protein